MSNGILKRDMKLLDLSLLPTMSDITDFYNCGTLYDWTNENFKLYPNVDLTGKKVLTVTGSGDHVLNCVLKGATKIDAFDINVFAKYYSALKCAMISSYGYYTFRYKIDEIIDNVKAIYNYKNEDFFKKVSHYLTEEELMFWRYYCELNEKKLPYGIGFLDDGTTIKKALAMEEKTIIC